STAMAMEIDLPKPEVLFRAAEDGDASLFASLSREALDRARSLRNEDGRSLLHVAASFGRSEASPHRCFANCVTLIVFVDLDVVDVISAADPSINGVNGKDEEGWAPIHSAASIGNAEIVEILLSRGEFQLVLLSRLSFRGDVNLTNDGGRTALHYAASKGWLKAAEVLISHGAKINKKDKVYTVALLLIRHGADLDVEDKEGYTALGRASNDFRRILIDAAKAMLEG
ncbi:hypothetical protein BHE74_00012184, partial [Ensete ventricosum]